MALLRHVRVAAGLTGLISLLAAVAPLRSAHAADGSWGVTTGGLWSDSAKWTGGTIADGQGFTATFNQALSGTATVNLDSARTIGNLSFTSGSSRLWRINDNGNPANVLTLSRSDATAPTITVNTSTRAEIATVIAGTGGLTKAGTGTTLILSAANTYSGTTAVSGGVLQVANGAALGTSSVNVTAGGLHVLGGVTVTGRSITTASVGNSSDGALSASGGGIATWAGPVTLASNGRLGTVDDSLNTTLVISGAVTGSATLDISAYGTGGVVLSAPSGQNTYSGTSAILRGRLAIGVDNSLPTTTVLDVHYNTATAAAQEAIFDLNGFSQQVGRLQNTGNLYGQATVTNSSASAGTLTVNQSVNTTYSGRISGAMSLVKSGTGTLTLAPTLIVNPGASATQQNTANTFTGTTRVNQGTLTLSAHSGTDSQALSRSTFDTDGAGTLSFGTMTTATFGGLTGAAGLSLQNASSAAVTLSLGGGNTTGSYGGNLTGAGGLAKVGTGTLTLAGTNTYAGNTAVNAGTLVVASTTAIPGITTAGRYSVAAGATLATPASFTDTELAAIVATGNFSANGILGIDMSGGNRTFANPLTGTVGLTVSGGTSLTLSGANALGPIVLNGSTLVVENTSALAVGAGGTGSITVNGGTITSNMPSNYSFNGRSIAVAGAGGTFRSEGGNVQLTFGNISGSAPVVFESGSGLIVTNSNTYSGGTTIKPGARIAYTSGTGFGSGPVTIQGGSLRSSQGTPQTVGNVVTLAGDVTFNASGTAVDNNLIFSGSMTLAGATRTVDVSMSPRPDATGIFFNGAIGDGGLGYGLVKTGPSMLILGGANTFGGATTVSAGTLRLTNAGAVGGSSGLSISAGASLDLAALGGGLTLGTGQSLGGAGSILGDLVFGSGSKLVFSTTDTLAMAGGTASFFSGTPGSRFGIDDLVGISSSTPTGTYTLISGTVDTTNLDNLGSTNAFILGDGVSAYFLQGSLQVVVVPEPESMAAVAAALAAIAVAFRRRRSVAGA